MRRLSATMSPEYRRLIRLERRQCLRLSALTYLVINMISLRKYAEQGRTPVSTYAAAIANKRAAFVRVTTGLVKDMLKEFDEK